MKICLDPGHGGNDTGAVGPTGLTESSVALTISQYLAAELGRFGVSVRLTRESDVYVSLGARCGVANLWTADYFVSVHLNSNGSTATGIETLYKTDKGKAIAKPIQNAMIEATGDRDRGLVYRDDLYVLNGTKMPAVLVETGFISNPEFEAKFKADDYRKLIAGAIASGIAQFLDLAPVPPQPIPPEPEPVPIPPMAFKCPECGRETVITIS